MKNKNMFSDIKPEPTNAGDLWFTSKHLFVAKRKDSLLVWKKRV